MASSSYCFGVVSLVVLLPFLFVSPSASTKFIDAICERSDEIPDKAFCLKTLNASPVASATNEFEAATATLCFVASYAEKYMAFAGKAAKENPNLKKQFLDSKDTFDSIAKDLNFAVRDLKESPLSANYTVMRCFDDTALVRYYIGKNTDKVSKTIISMSVTLDRLIALAAAATLVVGG